MKKNNIFFGMTALLTTMVGVLFFSKVVYAMPVGTLLYRTSAKGWLYGRGGEQDLMKLDFASSTLGVLPKLRINCGHAGMYVGKINNVDMVLEAVNNGVQLTPAQYFVNTREGEKIVGAKFPMDLYKKIDKLGEKEFKARIEKITNFFSSHKIAYDYEFESQKGPGGKQWTCVGLTEKIYESLGFQGNFTTNSLVYNSANYFIDITPDGLNDEDLVNPYNEDIFSETFEFSKITRRDFEKDGYALGKIVNGNRYFFLPYTQYLQGSLKDVPIDINLESSFDVDEIRGKTPGAVYVAYVDNMSGGKITNTKEKTKEVGTQIASGAKTAAKTVASAFQSAASATAKAGQGVWSFLPKFLKGAGEASRNSESVLVKGSGATGIPPSVTSQNKSEITVARAATELADKVENIASEPVVEAVEKVVKAKDLAIEKIEPEIKKVSPKIVQQIKPVQSPVVPALNQKIIQEIKPIVEIEAEKVVEKIKEVIPASLPLVHYPPGNGSQAGAPANNNQPNNPSPDNSQPGQPEEKDLPTPVIEYLTLVDKDSLSKIWTDKVLITVFSNIANLSSVENFALNESGLKPSSTDWSSQLSVDYSLSVGDGLKTVYSWISYKKGSVATSASAFIILDTTKPTSSLIALAESYEKTGWPLAWSGDDFGGSGIKYFNIEYSTSSDWQPWLLETASTSDFFDLPVAQNSNLSFRVRAIDNAGNFGNWSDLATTKIVKPAHLLISEFSTHGSAGAYDEFVELYNPSSQDVALMGWQLQSKSATASSTWVSRSGSGLPNIIIPAHSFALLAPTAYSGSITPNYLHSANWGLADIGGSLRLIDQAGNEIDQIDYGSTVLSSSTLFGFGKNNNYIAERKASKDSSAQTLKEAEKYSGNSFDTDLSDDFVLKIDSSPQNLNAPTEPNSNSALLPAVVLDLSASEITTSSLVLNWMAPERANFHLSAKYEIRYAKKVSTCATDLIWDSALIVSAPPSVEALATAQSVAVAGLKSGQEYCFGLKTFNGYNWSELSNVASASTLSLLKSEMVDVDYSPANVPAGLNIYYNLGVGFFAGQSFIPQQDNITAISLFGKRNGSFILHLCEGDWDFAQSVQANFNCDLSGQKLLATANFSNDTFPACNSNFGPEPCYSEPIFTKLSFASPITVEPNKKHFFILAGTSGAITLVGTRTDRWPSHDYPNGRFYFSDNPGLDSDIIFKTSYLSD